MRTILFQAFVYQCVRERLGNLGTYRWALLGLAVSMALIPWVSAPAKDGTAYVYYLELGGLLILRGLCAVGGLSSVMLLVSASRFRIQAARPEITALADATPHLTNLFTLQITNSSPSHEVLGTLNGVAQTLSAAGRSIGPLTAGGLFTLAARVQPRGELLAWGFFSGIAVIGWVSTLSIRGRDQESGGWEDYVWDNGEAGTQGRYDQEDHDQERRT